MEYSYYKNLGFDTSRSWSDKDLAGFLIWDYMEMMYEREFDETNNIKTAAFLALSKKFDKYKIIFSLTDTLYNKIIFPLLQNRFKNKKRKKVLFVTCNKYSSIILTTKKDYDVEMIVEGKKDRLFAMKHGITYDSYSDLNQYIYHYLTKKDNRDLRALADTIEKRIKKTNPDYIVMLSDCPPMERAIVLAAKKLGITTLEIQHGVYQEFFSLETGKVADYILVWGNYFKDLYVKQNIRKAEDVYVLGYPRLVTREKIIEKRNNQYVVYYLGQDFESYNKKFLNIKIETVKKINEICNKLGMKLIYRPHPGDNRELLEKNLSDIQFTDKKENLEETFKKADICISFQSTSLIEAAMKQKISLQLMNYPIKSDNFEKLGVCNKTMGTFNELENYLIKLSNASDLGGFGLDFNNDYIETRYHPGQRFLEILRDIEANNLLGHR